MLELAPLLSIQSPRRGVGLPLIAPHPKAQGRRHCEAIVQKDNSSSQGARRQAQNWQGKGRSCGLPRKLGPHDDVSPYLLLLLLPLVLQLRASARHCLVVFLPSRAAAFRTGDLSRPFGLVTADEVSTVAWEGTPLHSHVDVRARRSLTCPNQLLYIASDLGLRKLGRPPAASSIEGGPLT